LQSAGEFPALNPAGSGDIEIIFEEKRPSHLPSRFNCIYVFESLTDAKKHWSKMRDGKLYEVTVATSDILHRADMSLVDAAFINRSSPATVETCAQQYWSGQCGTKPVIEFLVKKARVSNALHNSEQERTAYFRSWVITGHAQQGAQTDELTSGGAST